MALLGEADRGGSDVWCGVFGVYDECVGTGRAGDCVGMGLTVQSAEGVSDLNLGSCKETW